jgi:hypothetical protein
VLSFRFGKEKKEKEVKEPNPGYSSGEIAKSRVENRRSPAAQASEVATRLVSGEPILHGRAVDQRGAGFKSRGQPINLKPKTLFFKIQGGSCHHLVYSKSAPDFEYSSNSSSQFQTCKHPLQTPVISVIFVVYTYDKNLLDSFSKNTRRKIYWPILFY